MCSGGKNEKHIFYQKKSGKSIQKKTQNYPPPKKKKPKTKEIYADVRTTQTESKQAIGYPNLALKSQISSLKHN